jgi:DNA polymerase V
MPSTVLDQKVEKRFALVDCNNFYVSCERLFNPILIGKPVVVLSNNDGCVVARSQEVKDLGIKMGVPVFRIYELIRRYNIQVYSSNYSLYGDLSGRVCPHWHILPLMWKSTQLMKHLSICRDSDIVT